MSSISWFAAILLGVAILSGCAGNKTQHGELTNASNVLSQREVQIESVVAPIALYPDPLLAQVLMASTYPGEVNDAYQWFLENPSLAGDDLNAAIEAKEWDTSVKSLFSFPPLLTTMGSNTQWTTDLGDDVLKEQKATFAAIQRLRDIALANGSLQSNNQLTVTKNTNFINISPVSERAIAVPVYDTSAIFGSWPYSQNPPMNFATPNQAAGEVIGFGAAVATGTALWAYCDWGSKEVLMINGIKYDQFNRLVNGQWDGAKNIHDLHWEHDRALRNAKLGVKLKPKSAERRLDTRGVRNAREITESGKNASKSLRATEHVAKALEKVGKVAGHAK